MAGYAISKGPPVAMDWELVVLVGMEPVVWNVSNSQLCQIMGDIYQRVCFVFDSLWNEMQL